MSVVCPTCGDDGFPHEKSMKQHHAAAHGESIAGVEVTCEECDDPFRVKPCREEEARFCSTDCRGAWRSENLAGRDSPHFESEIVPCDNCGDEVEVPPSRMETYDHHYCSWSCKSEGHSDIMSGEDHWNWKGGRDRRDYGYLWQIQRRRAKERDDYTCQGCGAQPDRLTVHHVIPFERFGDDELEEAHRLDNLVTLCQSCHNFWEGIPVAPRFNRSFPPSQGQPSRRTSHT